MVEEQQQSMADKLSHFLFSYRKPIIIGVSTVLGAFLIFTAWFFISEHTQKKDGLEIESISEQWQALKDKSETISEKEQSFIDRLTILAQNHKNTFVGARANGLIAEIYVHKKDWQKALGFYHHAASAAKESYLAGVYYFSAGVCADELGQKEDALTFYEKASSITAFPMRARALFNVGRVRESLSQTDKAIDAYNILIDQFPNNGWASLAQSRIIALNIQK